MLPKTEITPLVNLHPVYICIVSGYVCLATRICRVYISGYPMSALYICFISALYIRCVLDILGGLTTRIFFALSG